MSITSRTDSRIARLSAASTFVEHGPPLQLPRSLSRLETAAAHLRRYLTRSEASPHDRPAHTNIRAWFLEYAHAVANTWLHDGDPATWHLLLLLRVDRTTLGEGTAAAVDRTIAAAGGFVPATDATLLVPVPTVFARPFTPPSLPRFPFAAPRVVHEEAIRGDDIARVARVDVTRLAVEGSANAILIPDLRSLRGDIQQTQFTRSKANRTVLIELDRCGTAYGGLLAVRLRSERSGVTNGVLVAACDRPMELRRVRPWIDDDGFRRNLRDHFGPLASLLDAPGTGTRGRLTPRRPWPLVP